MKRRATHDDELGAWLGAEAADDAERAEAALAALVASLPLAAPPAGFAGRVLLRAGLGTRPASAGRTALPALTGYGAQGFGRLGLRRDLLARPWIRLALGATLAGAGALATLAPGLLRALLAALDPVALLTAGPRLVAAVGAEAAEILALAVKLHDVASALVTPLASPPVATALLAALLVAAAALHLLHHLMAHPHDRSWSYGNAHG